MNRIRFHVIIAVFHALELANGHVGVAILKPLDGVVGPNVDGLDILFAVRKDTLFLQSSQPSKYLLRVRNRMRISFVINVLHKSSCYQSRA